MRPSLRSIPAPSTPQADSGARRQAGRRHAGCGAAGTSSTGGKGEAAAVNLVVAKSGRTTGLTCGGISALNLDVTVDYYLDCAETKPYLTKTYTNQLAISGTSSAMRATPDRWWWTPPMRNRWAFTLPAERIWPGEPGRSKPGWRRFGRTWSAGGRRNELFLCRRRRPPGQLPELRRQHGGCGAGARTQRCGEYRAQQALADARALVNPATGILGVGTGKSSDHPGEGAVLLYVDKA